MRCNRESGEIQIEFFYSSEPRIVEGEFITHRISRRKTADFHLFEVIERVENIHMREDSERSAIERCIP